MRVAFLTPEFPTTHVFSGGLATFLGRLVLVLSRQGHDVSVITLGNNDVDRRVLWNGVEVVHVKPCPARPSLSLLLGKIWGRLDVTEPSRVLANSLTLSNAFHRADSLEPFDIVHGADFGLTTLYIKRRLNLKVIVRVSSASREIRRILGQKLTLTNLLFNFYEREQLRKADHVYAPSKLVARLVEGSQRRTVRLVRPPLEKSTSALEADECLLELPERFLLHFGNIGLVKGSDVLAQSLQRAWKEEPELTMVWAGTDNQKLMASFQKNWAERSGQVKWLGSLDRRTMDLVVQRAIAVVAPSRIDNLPNNVLEAQSRRIPVIGTLGSSIDEIVMNGSTGELVPIGDVELLGKSLVKAWRGLQPFDGSRWRTPEVFQHTEVDASIAELVKLFKQ